MTKTFSPDTRKRPLFRRVRHINNNKKEQIPTRIFFSSTLPTLDSVIHHKENTLLYPLITTYTLSLHHIHTHTQHNETNMQTYKKKK